MSNLSKYFPVDCPWPSEESDKIRGEAIAAYKELRDSGNYSKLYLTASSHWASQGYWIESEFPKDLVGSIVMQYEAV